MRLRGVEADYYWLKMSIIYKIGCGAGVTSPPPGNQKVFFGNLIFFLFVSLDITSRGNNLSVHTVFHTLE